MSGTGEVKDSNVISPWGKIKNNEPVQLRQPKDSTSDSTIPVSKKEESKADEVKDGSAGSQNISEAQNHKILNSTLNANAAEFVPLSNQNQNSLNHISQDDQAQDVMFHLKEALSYLINYPGKYDEVLQVLQELIEPYIHNESTLQLFISVILDECISEPNLRYNGVRLCSDLINKFGSSFRTVLLQRCQEEHSEFLKNAYSNDVAFKDKIQGFGMLLAELFLQIQIGEKSLPSLGQGLLKILQVILKNETEKGVKSVCQILKLAGRKLEEMPDSKTQLDEVFSRLQSICNYVDLDPNLRFIVTSVLEMRASKWGENSVQPSPTNAEIESNSEFFNDPVFFGPDGKVISEEETSFLQESIPFTEDTEDYGCESDPMDEEAYDAFQKFLSLNQNERNNQ